MTTKQMNTSHLIASVKQIARRLAYKTGIKTGQPVGPALMAAALAKAMEPEQTIPLLKASGIDNPKRFLDAIPVCSEAEAKEFDPLHPDAELTTILRGELVGFLDGNIAAEKALPILLKASKDDLLGFVESVGQISQKVGSISVYSTTKNLIRDLAAVYQPRYDLCYKHYYKVDPDTHVCNFLSNKKHKQFLEDVDQLYQKEAKAHHAILASTLYGSSPLGRCARQYGEMESDILGIAFLGELGLVGQGPLTVREIGWSLDPKNFHRILGLVKMKVHQLTNENILAVYPDKEDIRLQSHVLTSSVVMEEFLNYLRDADPLNDQDRDDMLKRI